MKHVYVFGAGASAASADTPLGRDLVWNYPADCGLFVPIKHGVSDLREENEKFSNFGKFLEVVSNIYREFGALPKEWDDRGPEIFNLYTRIEKKHYVDEILEILHRKEDSKGVEFVRRLIFEHLVESSLQSPNLLYRRFVKEVLKDSVPQEITVISFNFDFLLHEDFETGVYFDYLLRFDWINHNRKRIYAQNNPIRLIKLNGSLDWGICSSCNRIYLYSPHMFRDFYNNKKCTGKCGELIQPFIIVPHEKYGSLTDLLWASAEKELKRASKVTIIGYSFPDYDTKVKGLFSKSLSPCTELKIVDHCERNEDQARKRNAILTKYKRLFPMLKTDIDICLNGFGGYMDNHVD